MRGTLFSLFYKKTNICDVGGSIIISTPLILKITRHMQKQHLTKNDMKFSSPTTIIKIRFVQRIIIHFLCIKNQQKKLITSKNSNKNIVCTRLLIINLIYSEKDNVKIMNTNNSRNKKCTTTTRTNIAVKI